MTLTGNIGHFDLLDMASRDPALRDEAARNLERLRRANEPATDDQIWNVLVHLAATYPFPSSDPVSMRSSRALYLATIRGCTLQAVKGAVLQWAKTSERFFPKPGELKSLVDATGRDIRLALARCEAIAQMGENGPV